ncbi:hypothetical protein [Lentibacillus halophilus]|uniref:hypothetical protein n=1 Tax=Lentibacillus halophilus TaxID=295065 RepID=UPI0031D3ED05
MSERRLNPGDKAGRTRTRPMCSLTRSTRSPFGNVSARGLFDRKKEQSDRKTNESNRNAAQSDRITTQSDRKRAPSN